MKYKAGIRRRANEYEKALVEWWKKNKIFEKSVEQRPIDDSYVFYDGPPFITGMPHHGTLLSSIVKDAVPRYWTMRGKRVERRWGWDCHGLPAENFVEKQLGITDRREIGTKWSLEEYITKARESMVANSETWEGTIERVGRWVDFKGAYRTMDKNFMESVWWAFKTLYEAGKIYEGAKVLMYDTKFATPVSKSEVTMDNDAYQEVTDPSAYVKFAVDDFSEVIMKGAADKVGEVVASSKAVYLLAWTTTPWTLAGNMALAVNPEMEYAAYDSGDKQTFIAGKFYGDKQEAWKKIAEFKGKDLVGLEYESLEVADGQELIEWEKFEKNYYPAKEENAHRVYAAEFVSDGDGTGIVHIAPAYGEDDYRLGKENGIPVVDVLDEYGCYLPGADEGLKAAGVRPNEAGQIQIWEANKFIAKCLEANGPIEKIEYIKHEYPFNPRSKERIMYRAFPSWFFDVQGQKELMIDQNENINWFPEYLKHGRFEKNIEQAPDWNLSRDRFWATAMPVWKGDKGSVRVIGSYAELKELSGIELEDYHRPWVDEIEFEIDGEHFKRIDKVLDCWFESGSMPFAQLHYPFENKEKFERNYPADFIVEYVGQVRAWFYYIHVVNTSLAELGAFGDSFSSAIASSDSSVRESRTESPASSSSKDDSPCSLSRKSQSEALLFSRQLQGLRASNLPCTNSKITSSNYKNGGDITSRDRNSEDGRQFNAFKNVITTGTLAGNDGRKMSKSLGNYTDPNVLMDQYSADALRFLLLSSPVLSGEDFALIDKDVSDVQRKLAMIWNVYDFFVTYAEVDNYSAEDFKDHWSGDLKNPLDKWIIARLHELKRDVIEGMEAYDLPKATSSVLPFVDDLSNWFVRRSRRRFWKSEDDADKAEAYWTLWKVLSNLARVLAPFTPFLAEELWQNMVAGGDPEKSVHLQFFPTNTEIDEEILGQMQRVRDVIAEGLRLRMYKDEHEEQVKVRQPLAKLIYVGEKLPDWGEEIVKDEVNVKEVEQGEKSWIGKELTAELRAEGFARELIRAVQAARKKAGLQVDDRIRLSVSCEVSAEWREMVMNEVLAETMDREGNYRYDEIAKVNGENVTISLEKA